MLQFRAAVELDAELPCDFICNTLDTALWGEKVSLSLGQVWQVRGACVPTFSFLFPVSPVKRDESRILLVLGQDTDGGLQKGREFLWF